jgi:AcrR family transcriptional regulator
MSSDAAPRPRRDAARNRGLLIDAARAVFSADGLDAPLDRVAAHAGVSRATLYRHFADRDALWEAVVTVPLAAILRLAERAAAAPTAAEGLVVYLAGVGELESGPAGFAGIMTTRFTAGSPLAQLRERVQAQVDGIARRAAGEGGVRPDLAETDLALVSIALASVVARTRDVAPDAWRRLVRLVLEGVLEPVGEAGVAAGPVAGAAPLRRNEVWRAFSA